MTLEDLIDHLKTYLTEPYSRLVKLKAILTLIKIYLENLEYQILAFRLIEELREEKYGDLELEATILQNQLDYEEREK